MIAATIPVGPIVPPLVVNDGGKEVAIIRAHRAPTGKVTLTYRRKGGGVGMVTLDDIERLEVVAVK